jgi:hypothetical protein
MNVDKVIAGLNEHGPMTTAQLRSVLGMGTAAVSRAVFMLTYARKAYICGYTVRAGTLTGEHTPIYALGDLPDAIKKPALTQTEKRYLRKGEIPPAERRPRGRPRKVKPMVKPVKVAKVKIEKVKPVKVAKVKPIPKDNGRPVIQRIAIKPQVMPAPLIARPQPAGMWSGLMV